MTQETQPLQMVGWLIGV